MDFRLPIPKNWQDFESICHRLWSEIWNDPNAQKNGRQGQTQCGVDIFGTSIYSRDYSGVQCKDKDESLGTFLRTKELISECGKAKNFNPKISSFTVATTSPRDEDIQSQARQLNDKEKFPFTVQVWSWNDIESEIIYRPTILNHYYPNFILPEIGQSTVLLNRFSSKEQLYAYFTRPLVNNILSNQLKEYIGPLAYELSDNAYLHGKATYFQISIENHILTFKDNGKAFNPLTDLNPALTSSKSNVGSYVFDSFQKKFNGLIHSSYTRKIESDVEENILQFYLSKEMENISDGSILQLNVDLRQAYGRNAAGNLANTLPINFELKEIVLTVYEVHNISAFVEFIAVILKRLDYKQKLTISIPRAELLTNIKSWFKDERLNIQMR